MPQTELTGTWRVTSFTRWNKEGVASTPLGAAPVGYAVFDATGRAFIQLSRNPADGGMPEEIARSLMCYFGPYTISGDTLSVAVESGNLPADIGTTQVRKFTIAGDNMTVGTPGKYQATLQRVR